MTLSASLQRCRGQGFPPWLPGDCDHFFRRFELYSGHCTMTARKLCLQSRSHCLHCSAYLMRPCSSRKKSISSLLCFDILGIQIHLQSPTRECLKSKNVHNKRRPYQPEKCMISGRKWTFFFAVTNYYSVIDDSYLAVRQRGKLCNLISSDQR